MEKSAWEVTAIIILIMGGLNWGLTILEFNLLEFIFRIEWLVNVVYAIVAIAAIYEIFALVAE